jgi:hypothetical protein
MSNIALLQVGDIDENHRRTLPLMILLQEKYGLDPIAIVYKHGHDAIFIENGFKVVVLADYEYGDLQLNDLQIKDLFKLQIGIQPGFLNRKDFERLNVGANKKYNACSNLIAKMNPKYIFVWNGYTGDVANALRMLSKDKGIENYYLERGVIKDSIFVGKEGVNGFSELTKFKIPDSPNTTDMQFQLPGFGRKIRDRYCIKDDDILIFIPLQVETDTNIIFNSPIKSMRAFVMMFAIHFLGNKNVKIIVRTHPEEIKKNLNLPLLSNVAYINDGDISAWVDAADLTVSLNSTVALEAMIRGRKFATLGTGFFTEQKLGIDIFKKGVKYPIVTSKQILNFKPDFSKIKFFLSHLESKYIFHGQKYFSIADMKEKKGELNHQFKSLKLWARNALDIKKDSKLIFAVCLTNKDRVVETYRKNNALVCKTRLRKNIADRLLVDESIIEFNLINVVNEFNSSEYAGLVVNAGNNINIEIIKPCFDQNGYFHPKSNKI